MSSNSRIVKSFFSRKAAPSRSTSVASIERSITSEDLYQTPWVQALATDLFAVSPEDLVLMNHWLKLSPKEKIGKIAVWENRVELIIKLMRRSLYPEHLHAPGLDARHLKPWHRVRPSELEPVYTRLIDELRKEGIEVIARLHDKIQFAVSQKELPPVEITQKAEFNQLYQHYLAIDSYLFCADGVGYDLKEKWFVDLMVNIHTLKKRQEEKTASSCIAETSAGRPQFG